MKKLVIILGIVTGLFCVVNVTAQVTFDNTYQSSSSNKGNADVQSNARSGDCMRVSLTGDTLIVEGCGWAIVPGISAANHGGSNTIKDFDGNEYHTVKIGQQTWLKENLRSLHYANGTTIKEAWLYDNNKAYASSYGRLYSWKAVMNYTASSSANPSKIQGICPDGWHVPSKAEYDQLYSFLGGTKQAGIKLKEKGTAHWMGKNAKANNVTGFTALGAGSRGLSGHFKSLKGQNMLWTATESESNATAAYHVTIYDNAQAVVWHTDNKGAGYSVRCLKD